MGGGAPSTNLNNILEPGTYILNDGVSYSNIPSDISNPISLSYILKVIAATAYTAQQTIYGAGNKIWTRYRSYNSSTQTATWSTWMGIPRDGMLEDTDSINVLYYSGIYYASSNNTSLPEASNSSIIVMAKNNSEMATQLVINNAHHMYFRTKFTTGWQSWQKVTSSAFTPS